MGQPITGKDGKVEVDSVEIADITSWTLNPVSDNKPYVSSSTAGQTRRLKGNKDKTGSFVALIDEGSNFAFDDGDIVAIKLILVSGKFWSGNVMIDSTDWNVDVLAADPVEVTVNFGQDAALVFTG